MQRFSKFARHILQKRILNCIDMKMIKCFMLGFGLVFSVFVFNSCLKDDGYPLDHAWYSIATVHPLEDSKSFWISLDSGTSLWPVATNMPWFTPKEKQRALVVYSLLSDEHNGYDHTVKILDMKSILTKPVAENRDEDNDDFFGTDPVSITEMWIGDGYLNIIFEFYYGGNSSHFINLVENNDVNTPYFFEFRHNAYNDAQHYRRKGIVAFDLSSIDTKGKEVELTIQVDTFEGKKSYTIEYGSSSGSVEQNRNYPIESFIEIK